ncbi:hypothetical protein ACS0TY_032460 [Phlomoides rotata]
MVSRSAQKCRSPFAATRDGCGRSMCRDEDDNSGFPLTQQCCCKEDADDLDIHFDSTLPRYHYEIGFREFNNKFEFWYIIVILLESKWVRDLFRSKITGQPYMDSDSNESIWPPPCWCRTGQMVLLQAFTLKNPGRAYMTQGEPLYNELKELFAPNDPPPEDPNDDDDLIIIVDGDDEDLPMFQHEVIHALTTLDQFEVDLVIIPDSPVLEIVMISSDDDSNDIYGYFDSDFDLESSDDEDDIPVVIVGDPVGEVINPVPNDIVVANINIIGSDDEVNSPMTDVPIPSASLAAIRDAISSIPKFPLLRDGFSTSEEDSD